VVAAALTLALVACSAPTPAPTAVPTTIPNPVAGPQATLDPAVDPAEVEDAFLSDVGDLIAEADYLAAAPCDDLVAITRGNPNAVRSIRGFAVALKNVGKQQAVLDTDAVRSAVANLDHSMGELEGALSLCGISQR
jgi:hypothetical protein